MSVIKGMKKYPQGIREKVTAELQLHSDQGFHTRTLS